MTESNLESGYESGFDYKTIVRPRRYKFKHLPYYIKVKLKFYHLMLLRAKVYFINNKLIF
jgi:hypothetical protein